MPCLKTVVIATKAHNFFFLFSRQILTKNYKCVYFGLFLTHLYFFFKFILIKNILVLQNSNKKFYICKFVFIAIFLYFLIKQTKKKVLIFQTIFEKNFCIFFYNLYLYICFLFYFINFFLIRFNFCFHKVISVLFTLQHFLLNSEYFLTLLPLLLKRVCKNFFFFCIKECAFPLLYQCLQRFLLQKLSNYTIYVRKLCII